MQYAVCVCISVAGFMSSQANQLGKNPHCSQDDCADRPWTQIDRRSNLTYHQFVDEYKRPGVPVVLEGYMQDWKLLEWTSERLKELCGNNRVSFTERGLSLLETMRSDELSETKLEYERVFGKPLPLTNFKEGMTVSDFVDYATAHSRQPRLVMQDWSHIAHYVSPLNVHDALLEEVCPEMLADLIIPKFFAASSIFDDPNSIHDPILEPNIFFAPSNSRAYPAHLHGTSRDNLLLMLQGAKHFVHWPVTEHAHLYRLNKGYRTDVGNIGDVIFMANGITPNFDEQPDLAKADGYEVVAQRGDMLFVPCGGIHLLENIGEEPSIAVRLKNVDVDVVKCNDNILDNDFQIVDGSQWAEQREYFLANAWIDNLPQDISFVQKLSDALASEGTGLNGGEDPVAWGDGKDEL